VPGTQKSIMKRIAYIEEIEKMTSLQIGESAIIEFDGEAKLVEIKFTDRKTGGEETVQKYHFPILLHSHPKYPHLKEPIKLMWETIAREPVQLHETMPELLQANALEAKHYLKGKWEIEILDNKKTKLWILK